MPQTLLIYSLGGGWGHLNRSLALARVAAKKYQIKLISNSPYLSLVNTDSYELFAISPQANFSQTKNAIEQIIKQEHFDCLIVDTFPRGLGGELSDLLTKTDRPKILVNRYLNPEYIDRYQLKEFVRQNYNLILIPGENTPSVFIDLLPTIKTAPWLIRSSHELADLSTAATILGLNSEQTQPLIIVLASGYRPELTLYGAIAQLLSRQGYTVRCLSATLPPYCPTEIWRFHYPALECLWLANVLIGSGGYNTVFECALLDLPLIAIPHQRQYDCQESRIIRQDKCWLARNKFEAVGLARELLSNSQKLHKQRFYQNGTIEAVKQIDRCLKDFN